MCRKRRKSDETDSYSSTDEAGRPQYDRNHGGTVPGTDGARSAVLRGGASKWNMVDFGEIIPDEAVFYDGRTGDEMNNNPNTLPSNFINTHYSIHTSPLNNTKDAMNNSTPN